MQQRDLHIQQALSTIFGPRHNYKNLPALSLLKKAYRKRAMLFHPDRSRLTGMSEIGLEEKFKSLSHAYNLLASLIEAKNKGSYMRQIHNTHGYKSTHFHETYRRRHNYVKKIRTPRFRMRLGFFLYRKGIIDWNTTIKALLWQFSHRPRIGEIAVGFNYLRREYIFKILKNRIPGEKFCEAAQRIGLLDPHKANVLLCQQRSYNLPIGRYFIENNLVTKPQIERLVAELDEYNRRLKKVMNN
jgi:curved DNA-binding protein CbpA